MSVRRLHDEQPADFAFTRDNQAWAEEQIQKYPGGKQASAIIPLMWRAQEQEGWLTEPAIRYIADMLDMPHIRALEVATFYTMFHLAPVGRKAHVQVCGTTPCMLRGAGDLISVCKRRIAENPHERSEDGDFSWEEVECLGACVNAPMVQVFADTYEDLTPETFEAVLDAFAAGETPEPGPQSERHASEPAGGLTSLTELRFAPKGTRRDDRPVPPTAPARPAARAGAKARQSGSDRMEVVHEKPEPAADNGRAIARSATESEGTGRGEGDKAARKQPAKKPAKESAVRTPQAEDTAEKKPVKKKAAGASGERTTLVQADKAKKKTAAKKKTGKR